MRKKRRMRDLQSREECQQRAKARAVLNQGALHCPRVLRRARTKDSAVPAREFVTPRPVKEPKAEGYEGDDSEESPAVPMSSRPSKSVRSDDVIGFTPGAVAVFSQNLVFQRLGGDSKQTGRCFLRCLKDDNPAKQHLRDTINHLKKEV